MTTNVGLFWGTGFRLATFLYSVPRENTYGGRRKLVFFAHDRSPLWNSLSAEISRLLSELVGFQLGHVYTEWLLSSWQLLIHASCTLLFCFFYRVNLVLFWMCRKLYYIFFALLRVRISFYFDCQVYTLIFFIQMDQEGSNISPKKKNARGKVRIILTIIIVLFWTVLMYYSMLYYTTIIIIFNSSLFVLVKNGWL